MRTQQEIKLYLVSAPWWTDYMLSTMKHRAWSGLESSRFFNGDRGELTISGAFYWAESPLGHSFWKQANDAFLKWYNGP